MRMYINVKRVLEWYDSEGVTLETGAQELEQSVDRALAEMKETICKYSNAVLSDLTSADIDIRAQIATELARRGIPDRGLYWRRTLGKAASLMYMSALVGFVVILKKAGDQKSWTEIPHHRYTNLAPTTELTAQMSDGRPQAFWRGVDLHIDLESLIWQFSNEVISGLAHGNLTPLLSATWVDDNYIRYQDDTGDYKYVGGTSFTDIFKNLMAI